MEFDQTRRSPAFKHTDLPCKGSASGHKTVTSLRHQWRIQGGARDASQWKFYHFHAVFGKIICWRIPSRVDAPSRKSWIWWILYSRGRVWVQYLSSAGSHHPSPYWRWPTQFLLFVDIFKCMQMSGGNPGHCPLPYWRWPSIEKTAQKLHLS